MVINKPYETTAQIVIGANAPTSGAVRAITPGSAGNLIYGSTMAFDVPPPGVDSQASVIEMDGGTDRGDGEKIRARIPISAFVAISMGGNQDYVAWALSCPLRSIRAKST